MATHDFNGGPSPWASAPSLTSGVTPDRFKPDGRPGDGYWRGFDVDERQLHREPASCTALNIADGGFVDVGSGGSSLCRLRYPQIRARCASARAPARELSARTSRWCTFSNN